MIHDEVLLKDLNFELPYNIYLEYCWNGNTTDSIRRKKLLEYFIYLYIKGDNFEELKNKILTKYCNLLKKYPERLPNSSYSISEMWSILRKVKQFETYRKIHYDNKISKSNVTINININDTSGDKTCFNQCGYFFKLMDKMYFYKTNPRRHFKLDKETIFKESFETPITGEDSLFCDTDFLEKFFGKNIKKSSDCK